MKTLKKILLTVLVIFSIVFANGCHYVFYGQFKSMDKIQNGIDLNLYECCSIYTMHMATWMFGWPMSPVAAKECLSLHFPHKQDTIDIMNVRSRASLLSPKVVAAIKSLENKPIGSRTRVAWNGHEAYSLNSPERVAAIAVNPCVIYKAAYMDDGMPLYMISSSMQYPKYSRTKFTLGKLSITVHEGLFRYLQDKGWLSYYTAEYGIYGMWL